MVYYLRTEAVLAHLHLGEEEKKDIFWVLNKLLFIIIMYFCLFYNIVSDLKNSWMEKHC